MRCDHARPHLRRAGLGVQCARVARWRLTGLRSRRVAHACDGCLRAIVESVTRRELVRVEAVDGG